MKKLEIKNINHSFTLIEMIVSMAIIVVAITTVAAIYIYSIGSQEKITATTKLQQDAQFVLETMAKDIREYQIDYSSYTDPIPQPTSTLILIDSSNNRIQYRRNPTTCTKDNPCRLEKCTQSGTCTDSDFHPVSTSDVSISRLDFYIQPDSNPFSSGATSYRNPSVTIVIELQSYKERFGAYRVKVQQTIPQRYQEKREY
ncbi:type II secretion system protein [bacterium]|nr:type II secretion system protein [bacterium]